MRPSDPASTRDVRRPQEESRESANDSLFQLPAVRRVVDAAPETRSREGAEREPAQWPPKVRQALTAYTSQQSIAQIDAISALDRMLGIDDYA